MASLLASVRQAYYLTSQVSLLSPELSLSWSTEQQCISAPSYTALRLILAPT